MKNSSPVDTPWYNNTGFRRSYHLFQIICVVGGFLAWEAVESYWINGLQPSQQLDHSLRLDHSLGLALWLFLAVALFYRIVVRYELQLEQLNNQLQKQNNALRALEAVHDKRLVQLSQKLSLSLTELICQHEVALQAITDPDEIGRLSAAIDHAHRMAGIARELIEIKLEDESDAPSPPTQPVVVEEAQPLGHTVVQPSTTGAVKRKIYAST